MLDQDNDQIQQRRQHLAEIQELGHATYPHRFDRTTRGPKYAEMSCGTLLSRAVWANRKAWFPR